MFCMSFESEFYKNEMLRYEHLTPSREEVMVQLINMLPDLTEKVLEGRCLDHPIGVLKALSDVMKRAKEESKK